MTAARVLIVAGSAFQCAGVALVFWQLAAIESAFHEQAWFGPALAVPRRTVSWVRAQLRKLREKPVFVQLRGASDSILTVTGSATATVTRAPGRTIRERLDSHERQLEDLRNELRAARQAIESFAGSQADRIQRLEVQVNAETSRLNMLIKEVGLGPRRLLGVGAILILLGIILSAVGSLMPAPPGL